MIIISEKFKVLHFAICFLAISLSFSCNNEAQQLDDCGETVLDLLANEYPGYDFIDRTNQSFCFSDELYADIFLRNEFNDSALRVIMNNECIVHFEAKELDSLPEAIKLKSAEISNQEFQSAWLLESSLFENQYQLEFINSDPDSSSLKVFINESNLNHCF